MIKVRELLQAYLKTKHSEVYYQRASEKASFPYIVYEFGSILDDSEGHKLITVDIDGWDAPAQGDTTALETLMENINTGLNKRTMAADNLAVTFYLDTILPLEDDDKRIRRRKYIYQARLFERS